MFTFKYKFTFMLFVVLLLTSTTSCNEIVEKDITNDNVLLLGPGDGVVSAQSQITFWWEKLEGASHYRLQVVSPTFDQPNSLILDTLITNTSFSYYLKNGNYQWNVCGINGAYQTNLCTVRDLSVNDILGDLSNATVVLNEPTNNFATNNTLITFQWEALEAAESYKINIFGDMSFAEDGILTNTFTLPFDEQDATYSWEVTAKNAFSEKTSQKYTFHIDVTPPSSPTLLSPGNGLQAVDFLTWERDKNSDDIAADSVYIYDDNQIIFPGFPVEVQDTQYGIDDLAAGTYFWAVSSVDSVGNASDLSEKWQVIIP